MARKKVVFVIVEGHTDSEALDTLLERIFDRNAVLVHIMGGDITTKSGVRPDNILSRIGNEVRAYAKSNFFTYKDFQEIIHIVDMDGAYIPDECIIEDPSAKDPVYSTEEIRTCSVAAIVERNKQKRNNLENYVFLPNCGTFLIGYSICPATLTMYCMISLIVPVLKKKLTHTVLLLNIVMILKRSRTLSVTQISQFQAAIKILGFSSNPAVSP